MNPDILGPLLIALLGSGALSRLFVAMFPTGSAIVLPLEAQRYAYGPLTAVFCASGCAAKIVIRTVNVVTTSGASLPLRLRIDIGLDIESTVGGARAPWPATTSLGDLAIDVNTARGANSLLVSIPVSVSAASSPPASGYFRLRAGSVTGLDAITALGGAVDIGTVLIPSSRTIEPADIAITGSGVGGRLGASAINSYKVELVDWLKRYAGYAMNKTLCGRYGTGCPAQTPPAPPQISMPNVASWAVPVGVAALLFWAAARRR